MTHPTPGAFLPIRQTLARLVQVGLTCSLLAACGQAPPATVGMPAATPVSGDPQPQLETLWNAVGKSPNLLWGWRLTPPLPDSWPPTAATVWSRFAYGFGRDAQLADGERISQPWARVDVSAGRSTIIALANPIAPRSIQGTGPVRAEDVAPLKQADAVAVFMQALAALPPQGTPDVLQAQAYYRTWLKFNGAIADEVMVNPAFRAWSNSVAPTPATIAPRPTVTPPTDAFEIKFGETATPLPGLSLRFVSLVEDSRCPGDGLVQCVWSGVASVLLDADAGGQRTSLKLSSISSAGTYTKTTKLGTYTIELAQVLPEKTSRGPQVPAADYRVYIRVR